MKASKEHKPQQSRIIQTKATITKNSREPSAIRQISLHDWDKSNRKVYFKAIPGFGQNYGELESYHYNSCGLGHSEPNLISMKYTKEHHCGDWKTANSAVTNAGESRVNFVLYTERKPCNECEENLNKTVYTLNDKVEWSVPNNDIKSIVLQKQYIDNANQILSSNYSYMSHKRVWGVGCYKDKTPRLVCSY